MPISITPGSTPLRSGTGSPPTIGTAALAAQQSAALAGRASASGGLSVSNAASRTVQIDWFPEGPVDGATANRVLESLLRQLSAVNPGTQMPTTGTQVQPDEDEVLAWVL